MKTGQPTLGKLLRALRSRNGWTLKQMSDKSGIPVSTLSKVEHDRLTLTYDKLVQLSQRLGIRLADFFSETEENKSSPVTARRSIGRLDQAVQVTTNNYDYHYLCTELRRKRMIPLVTKIRAKTMEEFGELVRHSGEEYFYVLDGRVEVHTEFYDPVVLEPGESIYLDSQMGHAFLAGEGCEEATVLAVCSSPEEAYMNWLTEMRDHVARSEGSETGAMDDLRHFPTGRKVSRLRASQDAGG
jgi:transcriptional regulator with XRE-family HTH domain